MFLSGAVPRQAVPVPGVLREGLRAQQRARPRIRAHVRYRVRIHTYG